jgi:imidazolonepropionase-like amidohydrolase
VRGSDDVSETGTLNPNIRAEVAINPDSELIPVARANGVLLNLTLPEGSILPGSSAVLQLDGWTWQDLTLKAPAAIHVTWPSMTRPRARRVTQRQDAEETPKIDEQLRALDQAFADARAYVAAKNSPKKPEHDARWEAMVPLLEGKIPLVVAADEVRQIRAAVAFAAREKVRLIVFGGYDAPLCADLLKTYDIPVIVNGIHRLPLRADAPYDEPFTVPNRLREAGVKYCITLSHRFGGSDVRNLPYHAATAAAHGLPVDEALKSITLYPAQILGCADRVGSLEAGKDATLIVTDGDILETPTHVEQAFVQGRQVDLTSKHTRLYDKYREKYRRQSAHQAAQQAAGSE